VFEQVLTNAVPTDTVKSPHKSRFERARTRQNRPGEDTLPDGFASEKAPAGEASLGLTESAYVSMSLSLSLSTSLMCWVAARHAKGAGSGHLRTLLRNQVENRL
jgi:hypothetical protein